MLGGKKIKKKEGFFSLGYHLGCRNCPARSKLSTRLKSNTLRQADARGAVGWKPPVLLQSICLGIAWVIPCSFFASPAKPLRTCYKMRVHAAAFFLACLLQSVRVPFQLTAQTFLHLEAAQRTSPWQDHLRHQPVCRRGLHPAPPHTHGLVPNPAIVMQINICRLPRSQVSQYLQRGSAAYLGSEPEAMLW